MTFGLELSRGKGHRLEQPKNYQPNSGNFKILNPVDHWRQATSLEKKISVEIKTTLFLESNVHLIDIGFVSELSTWRARMARQFF